MPRPSYQQLFLRSLVFFLLAAAELPTDISLPLGQFAREAEIDDMLPPERLIPASPPTHDALVAVCSSGETR